MCGTSIFSQQASVLGINDRFTDEELIRDVFVKGFCSNVSNIETTGADFSMGNFFNGGSIIGIDQGIIISTGVIDSASGPNTQGMTGGFIGTTNDDDLTKIATSGIFDVSGVSFDFVPISNRVSFNYVFASEEYCEYVNTAFNDVFGFFVSGPGINGEFMNNGINVARIPGTGEEVSINNVNHEQNREFYIKNEVEVDADMCGIRFAPQEQLGISFDGFTIPLRAEFDVIPCETYTIRLMVADVHDPDWDSAVFLEMNSFDIGGNVQVTALSETGQDTVVAEGCTDGLFRFERVDTDISISETFDLTITENSTATMGVDFEDIDLSITFEEGQSVVEVPIELLEDTEIEDLEILGLGIAGRCPCIGGGRANLQISDAESLEADLNGYAACSGEEFNVTPNIIGGAPPYEYLWDDGSTTESVTRTITNTTPIGVVITDFCGQTVTTSTEIEIQDTPIATVDGRYSFCKGVDAAVPVLMEGNSPWNLIYRINNERVVIVEDIQFQPYIIPAQVEGEVRLLQFSDRTCDGIVEGVGVLESEDIEIETFTTPATCSNIFDGTLSFDILSSSPAAEINWLPDVIQGNEGSGLSTGNYQLSLRDERGCELDELIQIGLLPDEGNCGELNIYIPNIFSPNGDNSEDELIIHLEHDPSIESVASFSIFDRWGNRIFQRSNFATSVNTLMTNANRKFEGFSPGVVSYVVVFNMLGGTQRTITGTITIVK